MHSNSAEQEDLRAAVRAALTKFGTSEQLRAASSTPLRRANDLWQTLTEQIGVAALAIPTQYEGIGASFFENFLVLEELGRALAPTPMLSSATIATYALLQTTTDEVQSKLLQSLACGEITATLVWANQAGWETPGVRAHSGLLTGTGHYVLDAESATELLIIAAKEHGVGLYSVAAQAPGVTVTPNPVMDPTRPLATVSLADVVAHEFNIDDTFVPQLKRFIYVALACEQLGAAKAATAITVDYTKSRTQFGRTLGSFQAIKHRLAAMYTLTETAHSITYAAATALIENSSDATELSLAARIYVSDALNHIAAEMIQLHGGIGITWEHDAQLFFKRAHSSANLFGPAQHAVGEIATLAGLSTPNQ